MQTLIERHGATGLGPRLLVVVPTLNEADGIEACLASLMAGPGLDAARFVVADGGSTDGTAEIVARLAGGDDRLSLMRNDRRVQAAAVNDAARAADPSRDLIVRCDAHALYPPGYVLGVARALLDRQAAGLVVAMDTAPRPGAGCFEVANALAQSSGLGTGGSAHRGGQRSGWVDHGHHAGLRRDAFLAAGGYDETLPANEDAELDTRLARAGGRIWLEAGLRPTYHPRRTPGGLFRQYARFGEGRARHARRHGVPLRWRQRLPAALAPALVCASALGAVWPPAWIVTAGYAGALAGASLWLAARRGTPCGLLSGLALGTMHLAWSAGFWRGAMAGRAS